MVGVLKIGFVKNVRNRRKNFYFSFRLIVNLIPFLKNGENISSHCR